MPQANEGWGDRRIATPARQGNVWTKGPYLTQGRLPLLRPVIRIDNWRPLEPEQIGSKPKRWFEGPGGSRWLFKPARDNPKKGGGRYRCGDDWAEVVAADVGRLLGLPTAQVELAVLRETEGVLSLNIARRGAMIHGNELLAGRYEGYGGNSGRGDANYTVANAMETIARLVGPPDSGLTGPSAFAGYLVLDAVVGNTDRHHQNWAAIRIGRTQMLAPTYDHASSLGFLITDEERRVRLAGQDPGRTVSAFADRAGTPFGDATSPLEAAQVAVRSLERGERARWVARLMQLEGDMDEVVSLVPDTRMSEPSRRFASELMKENLGRIHDSLGGLL